MDSMLQTGQVIIDGWLKLTAAAQIAVLFKELRLTLHSILKELIRKPEVYDLFCFYLLAHPVISTVRTCIRSDRYKCIISVFFYLYFMHKPLPTLELMHNVLLVSQNATVVDNEVFRSMIQLLLEEDKPLK